ncbi:MAG TPA: hypothetical protein VGG25_31100 [Streptosporangiaceae bacterium]|jgi:predicted ATPase
MTHQRLKSVVVEGFTSIRSAEIRLRSLNVLVGAIGAGKSNFIRALSMLGRIVDGDLALFVGLSGGADALMSAGSPAPELIRLRVESDAGEYQADLVPALRDTLIFSDETIYVRDTNVATSLGHGHRESALTASEPPWVPAAAPLVETLRGCRVFHFHDTSRSARSRSRGTSPITGR